MRRILRPVAMEPGLTLEEALAVYGGSVDPASLPAEKGSCVELAEDGGEYTEILLSPDSVYSLDRVQPVTLDKPLYLSGNGAVIQGCEQDGFHIVSGEVVFREVTLKNFRVNISIDGQDKIIEDITIEKVRFTQLHGAPIQTGTTRSNGGIRRLRIEACLFENHDKSEHGNVTGGYSSIALNCANAARFGSVDNAVLEEVSIRGCIFSGDSRETINVMGGVCGDMFGTQIRECRNVGIRNLSICDNRFSGSYDATINVIAGFQNNFGAVLDGLEVSGNTIEFGLWGIFVIAGEPVSHSVRDVRLKNVHIHHNLLTMREGGCGEPSCAIAVNAGRIDFYSASCTDCTSEDIHIHDNTINATDRGIMIDAAHALLDADAPSEVSRCVMKRVRIENNRMKDVETCFLFNGAYFEGRRYDWRIGVPGADIEWQKPVEDNHAVTCLGEENGIEELVCRDNEVTGYSNMLQAYGAFSRGHAIMRNNTIKNALFKANRFEKGGMHLHTADVFLQDFAHDGGGNLLDIRLEDI